MALLVAHQTNNRKVVGSRPSKVMCITVLTGNLLRWTVRCGRPPLLLPSCRKLEFRLSALMDSDLAWVNGESGRQSWCYADAFQRSIISGAIYHLFNFIRCFFPLVLDKMLPFAWVIKSTTQYTRKPSYRWQTRATRKPAKIAPIRRAYNVVADNIALSSCV